MSKYIASDDYVEQVTRAIELSNPNDPSEELDSEAIKDLANYLEAVGYGEPNQVEPDEQLPIYFLYDLLKWTRANQ